MERAMCTLLERAPHKALIPADMKQSLVRLGLLLGGGFVVNLSLSLSPPSLLPSLLPPLSPPPSSPPFPPLPLPFLLPLLPTLSLSPSPQAVPRGMMNQLLLSLTKRGIISAVAMSSLSPDYERLKGYQLLRPYSEPPEDAEGAELDAEGEELEEEGEEEEEEEEKVGDMVWPLVSELPLEVQGYRLVESFGPEGINASVRE